TPMSQFVQVSDGQLQCLCPGEPGEAGSRGRLVDRCKRPPPSVPRSIARELDPDERDRIGSASDEIRCVASCVFSTSVSGPCKKKPKAGVSELLPKASDHANDNHVVHRTCDQPHQPRTATRERASCGVWRVP